jgi:hypothetical protein
MQVAKRQSAAQHGVEAPDAKRLQPGACQTDRGRTGRSRISRDRVQFQPRLVGKPPLKAGNILAQTAKHRLRAMTDGLGHGRSHFFLFFICSIKEQTGKRVKQADGTAPDFSSIPVRNPPRSHERLLNGRLRLGSSAFLYGHHHQHEPEWR